MYVCASTHTHICRKKTKSKGIRSRIFKSAVTSGGERRGHTREGAECLRGKVASVPEVGNGDSFMLLLEMAQTYYMHSFLDGMHFTKRRKDGREVGGRWEGGRKEEREGSRQTLGWGANHQLPPRWVTLDLQTEMHTSLWKPAEAEQLPTARPVGCNVARGQLSLKPGRAG